MLSLNSNALSLQTTRGLAASTSKVSKAFERLSSGLRINRASDDAAGLSISKALEVDSRIYGQAIRNINDSISCLNMAEGALGEITNIVIRLMELAQQSANGAYSSTQRKASDTEGKLLIDEYNRIIASTSFNGGAVFDAFGRLVSSQAGAGSDAAISFTIGSGISRAVGDGTFILSRTQALMYSYTKTADLNNDGKTDIIAFNDSSAVPFSYNVATYLSNGDGTFASWDYSSDPEGFLPPDDSSHGNSALADFNGDGKLDVFAITGAGAACKGWLFTGSGDGTFNQCTNTLTTGDLATLSMWGDFNGDGKTDILATQGLATYNMVYLGNGNGTFKPGVSVSISISGTAIDLNGDGKQDILGSSGYWRSEGNGTFVAQTITGISGGPTAAADLNEDGSVDVVAKVGTQLKVALGNGDGTFQSVITTTGVGSGVGLKLADFNGDGLTDAITKISGTQSEVYFGDGKGFFSKSGLVVSDSSVSAVTDFNNDGAKDLFSSTGGVFFGNSTRTLGQNHLILTTRQGALDAISRLSQLLVAIESERARIGAAQSRLQTACSVVAVGRENSITAAHRITDADIGEESAGLIKNKILQDASAALLAQSNKSMELALALLS